MLIMDASGSMRKSDVGTGTRMTAAQDAAAKFVSSLPSGSKVGLVSYGDKTLEEAPKSAGCSDVSAAVPLGTDAAKVTEAAKALKPVGWTPIAKALQTAAAQAKGGPLNVVLVTDGEDSCAPPDPCETAASLVSRDAGLTISAIGLKASSDQLSCIAAKGKGYFVTASNSAQLARRLEALRDPQAAAGKLSPSGVRSITPGQLADDIRKAHPDFPQVADGTQVRVVWAGCTWVFSAKGVLISIELGDSASTIDGLAAGDAASALSVLGTAVSTSTSGGVETRIYPADERLGLGWKVQIKDGRIITIVLCTCLTGTCPPSADQVRKAGGDPEGTDVGNVDCVADGTWAVASGTFGPMKNSGWLILRKNGASWTTDARITSTSGCGRISAEAPLAELRKVKALADMCDVVWGPAIVKQAPITMDGIGALALGADGSDLNKLGLALPTDGQCDANYTTASGMETSIASDFRGNRLTGLWVRDPKMRTTSGARVGMSVAEVKILYGGRLTSGTHENFVPIKTLMYTSGGMILEFSYSDPDTGAETSTVNGIYVSFSDVPFKHGC